MIRVVVVTDRRRFPEVDIVARVAAILEAAPRGAVAIQVREKDLDGGPLLRLVREVMAVATPAGAPVLVNDRADVALAAGADGVHLPERGLAIADVRALRADWIVGCSRHAPGAVAGADWIQLGPIWDTPGKGPPLGPGVLATSVAPARLVAVGGIDSPERARAAAEAGADAVAVIRAAWTGPPERIAELIEMVRVGRALRESA